LSAQTHNAAPGVGGPNTKNKTVNCPRLVAANRRATSIWLMVGEVVANGVFELSNEISLFSPARVREDVEAP